MGLHARKRCFVRNHRTICVWSQAHVLVIASFLDFFFFFLQFAQISSLCIIGRSKKRLVLRNQWSIFVHLQASVVIIEGVLAFG